MGGFTIGVKVHMFVPGKSHVLIQNISERPLLDFTVVFVKLLTAKKNTKKGRKESSNPPSESIPPG